MAFPRLLIPLAAAVLLCPSAAARAAVPPADLAARLDSLSGLARGWYARGAFDSLQAALGGLADEARARGDVGLEARASLLAGQALASSDRLTQAEPLLQRAAALATTLGDSTGRRRSLRWLGYVRLAQGRFAESKAYYAEALALAEAAGDRGVEGWSRTGLAYLALRDGDTRGASAGYTRALGCFDAVGDRIGQRFALTGLANVQQHSGDFERARQSYRRLLELSRADGDEKNEAYALFNLGNLDMLLGDPAVAVERWQQALAIQARRGWSSDVVATSGAIARALTILGRHREAEAGLDSALAVARREGYLGAQAELLQLQADLAFREMRLETSLARSRDGLALADDLDPMTQASLVQAAARALRGLGRSIEALALMDSFPTRRRLGLDEPSLGQFEVLRARLLGDLGRAREGVGLLRPWLARQPGTLGTELALAQLWQQLGEPDSSLAALERATATWERQRRAPGDREWREQRGSTAYYIYGTLAGLLLGGDGPAPPPERVERAFDALQRFKARTLAERVAGPAGMTGTAATREVTLAALQREVLEPGELLLDIFSVDAMSWMFAVTRDEARVVRLPGREVLAPRIERFLDLIERPGHGAARRDEAAFVEESAASLGDELLAPVADLLRGSRRVVFCPDGSFNRLPLESLGLPGGTAGYRPLCEALETARIPSASMLAGLRERRAAGRANGGDPALLALAGAVDGRGRPLAGAAREVEALARGYHGVEAVTGGSAAAAARSLERLPRAGAVHVAAHTHADDQYPWHSGILLGAADSSAEDPWLRASTLASLQLGARLAVLSGCESALGRVRSGEGVQGLSAAFMSAGVPCVIATLWPVEDAVTARLMARFYEELAAGATAGEALRQAQAALRRDPATRHPFYWAGFVLAGDGGVGLQLQKRLDFTGPALAVAGLLVLLLGFLWRRRRRARPL